VSIIKLVVIVVIIINRYVQPLRVTSYKWSARVPLQHECYDTMLLFLEYQIVAMGRRGMNADVAVMH
jgi:hypothetical protein